MKDSFYSNGKLLITGEYVVLDGAKALAIPTSFGQSLQVKPSSSDNVTWKSFDSEKNVWFTGSFSLGDFEVLSTQNETISSRLQQILQAVRKLNTNFLSKHNGFKIQTNLDFPRDWGLGTSSTLINNIAQWANVNPFELLELTFGGSGYDIACATNDLPITYQLLQDETLKQVQDDKRIITIVDFNPSFTEHLYFVYLNKKQNSRDGIAHYKSVRHSLGTAIDDINLITAQMIDCPTLEEFESLMRTHETLISKVTRQDTIQSSMFNDFNGAIKSLGAWGGDFVLVASESNPFSYFNNRGFDTIITYSEMVK
ncbi:MAG: GYDIA family GHMP kinase [Jejuia sp.]